MSPGGGLLVLLGSIALLVLISMRTPALAAAAPDPVVLCATSDSRLAELSGLATDGGTGRWVITDGGRQVRAYQLGTDCAVRKVITAALDPVDPEDLARSSDGTLWLADTGDNGRTRGTVALLALTPAGRVTRYALRYPDGPHDVEALLLARDRTPVLVTKEVLGAAGVYTPTRPLDAAGVVELRRVADVGLPASDSRGGPIGGFGGRTITGGATTTDGRLAALRTYTDAWLFDAPDGDLVAALGRAPVRVPLPGEPQGEAIAFDAAGGLLSGSERRGGEVGMLRLVPGAVALARPESTGEPAAVPGSALPTASGSAIRPWLYGGAVVAAVYLAAQFFRSRRD